MLSYRAEIRPSCEDLIAELNFDISVEMHLYKESTAQKARKERQSIDSTSIHLMSPDNSYPNLDVAADSEMENRPVTLGNLVVLIQVSSKLNALIT